MFDKRIGYWVSEKKSKKLNFSEFEKICSNVGLELVKIELNRSLEHQGPFHVIIHKTTDIVAQADQDPLARRQMQMFEKYVADHPEVIMIDPMENVQMLLNRYLQYSILKDCEIAENVFTPKFVEFTNMDMEENKTKMLAGGVSFPFICKSSITHGYNFSHQMAIIFNEKGLKDVSPPCVAHTFINHNAVLYKLFMVGEKMHVVTRPSIKNLSAGAQETIFFDSHDVSKSNAESFLNKLDKDDTTTIHSPPSQEMLQELARSIQSRLGMNLFGIDVIVENDTRRLAVIDMNVFPSYDGVPDFFQVLLNLILQKLSSKDMANNKLAIYKSAELKDHETFSQERILSGECDKKLSSQNNCSHIKENNIQTLLPQKLDL